MTTIENIRKIIAAALLVTLMIPAIQHCAALPEETEIPEAEQQILDERLFRAIKNKNHAEVKLALKHGANPNAIKHGLAALRTAANRGNLATVQQLITAGADLNTISDEFSFTALLAALMRNHSNITQALIDANADLNTRRGSFGTTALMLEAMCKSTDSVYILIKAGADESLRNAENKTAQKLITDPKTVEAMQRALAERDCAQRKYEQCITKKPQKKLKKAYFYLLESPLPIRPLTGIFLQYATESNLVKLASQQAIEATERQKQRAEETRKNALIWRAQQRGTP